MDLTTFAQQVFNGLSTASIYALIAVGITLTFGLTRLVNFAHGEIVAVGAYAVFFLAPKGGASFIVGLIGAVLVTGVLSFVLERGLFRFTLDTPVNGFLVSLGLILIIQNALVAKWTINPKHADPFLSTIWEIGGVRIGAIRVIVIIVTVATFALLSWVFTHTWFGMAARAASMDREMLSLTGVPVARVITSTFVLGGMLAGLAGAFIAELNDITPLIGFRYVLKAFAVAIVGGLGNVKGAIYASLIFAMGEAMAIGLGLGAWVEAMVFGGLVAMVLIRPQGLLRGTEAAV